MAQGPGVDHGSPRDREAPSTAEAADAAGQQLDFTPTGTVPGSSPPRRKEAPATGIVPDFAVRANKDGVPDRLTVYYRGRMAGALLAKKSPSGQVGWSVDGRPRWFPTLAAAAFGCVTNYLIQSEAA